MKFSLFIVLLVLISSISAFESSELGFRRVTDYSGGGSGTDDYNQAFDFDILQNGYSNYSGGNRWVCDDFELVDSPEVDEIYIWMLWIGAPPSIMNLVISEDDTGDSDPNITTDVWAESIPCINTFTGFSNWGYDIYETYCEISPGVNLNYSTHYYFETQAVTSDNCFVLVSPNYYGDYCWIDDGSGVWVRSDEAFGEDSDMFFVFIDMNALEPETWGSIKTLL